jgi:hypothetical protein
MGSWITQTVSTTAHAQDQKVKLLLSRPCGHSSGTQHVVDRPPGLAARCCYRRSTLSECSDGCCAIRLTLAGFEALAQRRL